MEAKIVETGQINTRSAIGNKFRLTHKSQMDNMDREKAKEFRLGWVKKGARTD